MSITAATAQTACAAGTYNPNTGSTSSSACITTAAGHYSGSGAASETACSAGTYNPNTGSTSSSACIFTDAGYYTGPSAASQTACSPGTYQPSTGQSSCIDASPGHYVDSTASTSQSPCGLGTYQPESGQSSCLNASAGHYVDSTGAISQTACNPGTYQNNTGQSSCIYASPGHYTEDTWIDEGFESGTIDSQFDWEWSNESLASANWHLSNDSSFYGTYSLSAGPGEGGTNTQISLDYHFPSDGIFGFYYMTDTEEDYDWLVFCLDVNPCNSSTYTSAWSGHNNSGWHYEVVSAGHHTFTWWFYKDSSWDCDGNATNTCEDRVWVDDIFLWYDGASTSQTACEIGTYQPDFGQSSCLDADSGHYVDSTAATSQTACNPGTYQPDSAQSSCLEADPGHYVDSQAATIQTPCPDGTYQPYFAQDACLEAAPGHYAVQQSQSVDDGFETGDLTALNWLNDDQSGGGHTNGDANWVVTNADSSVGNYSIMNNQTDDSELGVLEITLMTGSGNVTWDQKISTESGYDFLVLYVDYSMVYYESGSTNWTSQSHFVTTGEHTFHWVYYRDLSLIHI
mgnify:CR=1 FL=1